MDGKTTAYNEGPYADMEQYLQSYFDTEIAYYSLNDMNDTGICDDDESNADSTDASLSDEDVATTPPSVFQPCWEQFSFDLLMSDVRKKGIAASYVHVHVPTPGARATETQENSKISSSISPTCEVSSVKGSTRREPP